MSAPTFGSVTTKMDVTTKETISLGPGDSADVVHSGMNTDVNKGLTPSSTPPAQALAPFKTTLSSGTATIDLTSLTDSIGGTLDGATCGEGSTATKVQIIKIQAPVGNANPISVAPAASNGYKGSGGGFIFETGGLVNLNPGDEVMWTNTTGTSAPTISSSVKDLTLTGTGSSDSLNFTIILG